MDIREPSSERMACGRAKTQRIDRWQGRHRRTTYGGGQQGTVKFRAAAGRCQGVISVGNPRMWAQKRPSGHLSARLGWAAMAGLEALRFAALGALCELYAVGPADLAATRDWVNAMHDRLTRFEPDSELSRLNAAAGHWVDVAPELEALLRLSLDAHASSNGLVHIGVLPALLAAGYTRDFASGPTAPTGEVLIP